MFKRDSVTGLKPGTRSPKPVLVGLVFRAFQPTLALFSAYVATSILLGFITAKLIERPALRLREQYFPPVPKAMSAKSSIPLPASLVLTPQS